jgi:shikimate kinase
MNNISFIGMAGCGKSTLGKAIAEKYDLSFVDTDKLIESNWQMTLEEIKTKYGYETVIRSEQEVILNLNKSIQIISTGGSAIYSDISMEHLKSFSKIVYIDTPLETIIERIDEGQERGLAVPGNPSIEDVYFDRKPLYEESSQHTIDGSKSIDELIEIVLNISDE